MLPGHCLHILIHIDAHNPGICITESHVLIMAVVLSIVFTGISKSLPGHTERVCQRCR